ncbi:MAG: DNA polymerase III subunit delta [Candidatus Peregrinibacteria bacterium Greene0416_19]|nr:MAG: DNA polymerase III subunit delta [Candidatus Peregrinibacteria bacterium Greene0416_19]
MRIAASGYTPGMQAMHIFTGENTYAIREERRHWIAEFLARHGPDSLSILSRDIDGRSLLDEAGSAPFIAERRLILIDGMPRFSKDEVGVLASSVHPGVILLFVDPAPDRRLAGVKTLMQMASVKEFPDLPERELLAWMRSLALANGSTMTDEAARALIDRAGGNQESLWQEIIKLSIHASGRSVTVSDVEELAVPSGEQEVWHLTSLIASRRPAEAILYCRGLLERGEDPFSIWNILLWNVRNTVSVWSMVQDDERNPAVIAAKVKVPFPAARTLLTSTPSLSSRTINDIASWCADADVSLKTGEFRATGEAPGELLALIDRLILTCCTA